MMNKDLIEFTKSILSRYNATPDEWDAFESVKWSMGGCKGYASQPVNPVDTKKPRQLFNRYTT